MFYHDHFCHVFHWIETSSDFRLTASKSLLAVVRSSHATFSTSPSLSFVFRDWWSCLGTQEDKESWRMAVLKHQRGRWRKLKGEGAPTPHKGWDRWPAVTKLWSSPTIFLSVWITLQTLQTSPPWRTRSTPSWHACSLVWTFLPSHSQEKCVHRGMDWYHENHRTTTCFTSSVRRISPSII